MLTLPCHGCPVQAIVAAFGLDERTVADWQARGGQHCQRLHEHIVGQGRVDLGHVQADEIWVKMVGKRVRMAMAMAVPSRPWLGGVLSVHRDRDLIMGLVEMVRSRAANLNILVYVDGLASHVTAFLHVFRNPVRTGKAGRPRLVLARGLMLGQVVKQYAQAWIPKRPGGPSRKPIGVLATGSRLSVAVPTGIMAAGSAAHPERTEAKYSWPRGSPTAARTDVARRVGNGRQAGLTAGDQTGPSLPAAPRIGFWPPPWSGTPEGLPIIDCLVILRDKLLSPLLAALANPLAADSARPKRGRKHKGWTNIDDHHEMLRITAHALLSDLHFAAA